MNEKDDEGNTALMRAVSAGDVELIKCLVRQGADVNAVNKYHDTALLLASRSDDVNVLKILIEAAADVNYVGLFPEQTALTRAWYSGKKENVKLLLEAGADVNAGHQRYPGIMCDLLIQSGRCPEQLIRNVGVNAKDIFGFPLIILATREEYGRAVPSLIREGADVNALDQQGNTALHTINTRVKGCLLLAAGARINIFNDQKHNALRSYIFWRNDRALDYRRRRVNIYSPEYKEPLRENICMLLYAAGETLDGTTVKGQYVPEHIPLTPSECLLYRAEGTHLIDDFTVMNKTLTVPEYLRFKDLKLCLRHLCREAIRRHLLDLDLHTNLFVRALKLELPKSLTSYILYDQLLDDDNILTT